MLTKEKINKGIWSQLLKMVFLVVTGIQQKARICINMVLYFLLDFHWHEENGEENKRKLSHLDATISALSGPWQWSVC